ncbi:MAG: hypothetical protein HYW24_01315 [Candidatus Aenigmarchaeota archaeon]|nr:hypothetical protein [Candidatus Aenigmarchaeota archaeon]
MRIWTIALLSLFVLVAGCIDGNHTIVNKNDVVTIENYFVTDPAPFTSTSSKPVRTNIQFDVFNNGDQKIPYLEVDFFDLSGFTSDSINCGSFAEKDGNKCIFTGERNSLLPLDSRSITMSLITPKNIESPTPYTVSFAVRYVYHGFRQVNIPIIDGVTKKEPTTQFKQSEPSVGPVVLDIEPSIERTIQVDDQTVKQYWGIGGDNPLPFFTKFKFSHIGTVEGRIKDVNITRTNVRFGVSGLQTASDSICSDFKGYDPAEIGSNPSEFNIDGIKFSIPEQMSQFSTKHVLVPFDTLFCTFLADQKTPEYAATISAYFAYKYEFIKSQEFAVQPLPK